MAVSLDAQIVERVATGHVDLPPYPAAALRLSKVLEDAASALGSVVEVVREDPTLAAAVLRLANSALCRGVDPVTTLPAAIARIGNRELLRLALAAGLANAADAKGPLSELRREAWHLAVTTSLVSEALAPMHGLAQGEAFLCGLLHDMGRLVAIRTIEDLIKAGGPVLPAKEWWELVERFHVELGLVLAARWGLPDMVSDVISQHHAEEPAGDWVKHVGLVRAASAVVALIERGGAVTAAELAAVLSQPEARCQALAAALPTLSPVVAGFQAESATDTTPSLVARAPVVSSPSAVGRSTFRLRTVGRTAHLCRGISMTERELVAVSPVALSSNYVFEFELEACGGARVWVKVLSCEPKGEEYEVRTVPFAASGRKPTWSEVVRSVQSAPEAA